MVNNLKSMDGCSPIAWIAYRIFLIISATVAFWKISFLKLKLIKSYLRLIISQIELNNLAMLTIETKITEKICCISVIITFPAKNAWRVIFKWLFRFFALMNKFGVVANFCHAIWFWNFDFCWLQVIINVS